MCAEQTIRLGITMGDPAGIGPEIIVKLLHSGSIPADTDLIIFGNPMVLKDQAAMLDIALMDRGTRAESKFYIKERMYRLIDPTDLHDDIVIPGTPMPHRAPDILRCIDSAVMWALEGKIDGMVTTPVNKETIRRGGFTAFTGHTEYLARLTGAKRTIMMLTTDMLRVVLATTHVPFAEILSHLTQGILLDTFYQTDRWFQLYLNLKPRIAVAGLNPHAGEGGTLGEEELALLIPAINQARDNNINVRGPFAADTIFRKAIIGEYDVVVAMYHDQGMIPIKLNPRQAGVNITIGLPIIRTSVDHGTAYDIAGGGKADPTSLYKALLFARKLVTQRKKYK